MFIMMLLTTKISPNPYTPHFRFLGIFVTPYTVMLFKTKTTSIDSSTFQAKDEVAKMVLLNILQEKHIFPRL